ncbi:MAG: hypothetical protein MJ053_04140 [Elusimicrobiaceae bacterium]|nr:hypothetical protein [Elusimicrobiaceae bacterium]
MTTHYKPDEIIEPEVLGATLRPDATTRTLVGCLRGTIAGCAGLVCAAAGGLGVGLQAGIWPGVFTGLGLLVVFVGTAVYLMNHAKQLTVVDCILPLPIGAVSALVFAPVGWLGGSMFSAVTCLGASFLLCVMLLMYRANKIHGGWLIVPFVVFLYELLPVELPTDLDNMLSLGGDGINCLAALVFPQNKDLLK